MSEMQPSGTVTLVFTDVEGSTKLLEELGTDAYRKALAEHRRVVREVFGAHRGYEVDYEGDAFFYAFASAQAAVSAVAEAMVGLEAGPICLRVGIHTGEPALDPPKYVGMDVHRAARIMSAAHGGQVMLSSSTVAVLQPGSFDLTDLGEHRLKDLRASERVYQLGEREFPTIRSLHRTNLPVPATPFIGRETELSVHRSARGDAARDGRGLRGRRCALRGACRSLGPRGSDPVVELGSRARRWSLSVGHGPEQGALCHRADEAPAEQSHLVRSRTDG